MIQGDIISNLYSNCRYWLPNEFISGAMATGRKSDRLLVKVVDENENLLLWVGKS